jgi:hypothetical protein
LAVHLYGVMRAGASLPNEAGGRQGAPARLVEDGGLVAIVSDVDVDARPRRDDLLAHAHLLEAVAEQNTVVPMRFGIAVSDDEEVRQRLLREQRESLQHLLQTLDGLEQVTVQAFHHEQAILREVIRRNPELAAARSTTQALPVDAARPEQIDLGRAVAAALEDLEEQDRVAILERLSPHSVGVSEHDARGEHQVVHAAFLVKRGERSAFDAAVGELRREQEDRLRIRYVGPQPPYAFLEAASTGDLAWA